MKNAYFFVNGFKIYGQYSDFALLKDILNLKQSD